MSNLERLAKAGIVGTDVELTDKEQQAVDDFSDEEIDALIQVHDDMKKAGEATHSRPKVLGILA